MPQSNHLADVELALPARAENVSIVRHAFGALAEVYAVPTTRLADIKLAISEACANVVLHAYEGNEGLMEIAADCDGDQLTVVVRDHGHGITPRTDSPGLGVGLPLITTLSDKLELCSGDNGGTEVRMTFNLAA